MTLLLSVLDGSFPDAAPARVAPPAGGPSRLLADLNPPRGPHILASADKRDCGRRRTQHPGPGFRARRVREGADQRGRYRCHRIVRAGWTCDFAMLREPRRGSKLRRRGVRLEGLAWPNCRNPNFVASAAR